MRLLFKATITVLFCFMLGMIDRALSQTNVLVEGKKANTNIKLPVPNQATDLGRNQVLIETGNSNLLKNPSFESSVNGESWTVSTVSGAATCTLGSAASLKDQYGKKHLLAECSGVGVVEISQAVSTAKASMIASIFALKNAGSGKVELVTYSDDEQNTQVVSYPEDDEGYLKKMSTIDFLSGETNTKIAVRITRESGDATMLLRLDLAYLGMSEVTFSSIKMDSDWKSYGPIQITATTTNPTKGTMEEDDLSCRQDGDFWDCRIVFVQTAAGAGGNGTYEINLPEGIEAEDSWTSQTAYEGNIGSMSMNTSADPFVLINVLPYLKTSKKVYIGLNTATNNTTDWSNVQKGLGLSSIRLSGYFRFKGKGLRSNLDVLTSKSDPFDLRNRTGFDARVSSTGEITQSSYAGWLTCSWAGNVVTCNFPDNIFKTAMPMCSPSFEGGANSTTGWTRTAQSKNAISIGLVNQTGSGVTADFTLKCYKQGQDLIEALQGQVSAALHAKNIVGMARYIVKTIHSGASWAEVYNDGWVVQKVFNAGTVDGAKSVNVLVRLRDANYYPAVSKYFSTVVANAKYLMPISRTEGTVTINDHPSAVTGISINYYGDSAVVKSHGATPDY